MPPIILRVQSSWGKSRITISPSDSLAELKRIIAKRSNNPTISSHNLAITFQNATLDDESSSIRSYQLSHGDNIKVSVVDRNNGASSTTITASSKNNTASSKNNTSNSNTASSKHNRDTTNDTSTTANNNMPASIEGHTLKFIAKGNVVPLAPTIAGRREQRLQSLSSSLAATFSARTFTEPKPFSSASTPTGFKYESWSHWLRARTNPSTGIVSTELDIERELSSTLLQRRGTNVLPPTITVQRQKYRHVDRIVLKNQHELKRFASGWLDNHVQRCGYLIGNYSTYVDQNTNMKSICATVEAVYEPPQISDTSGVRMTNEGNDTMRDVVRVATMLNMHIIGFVFTHAAREEKLTAEEIRLISRFQEEHRQLIQQGIRQSRFVTLTLTKNTQNEIVPRGFMASDTSMVLERNNMFDGHGGRRGRDMGKEEEGRRRIGLDTTNEGIMYIREPLPGRILPIIVAQDSSVEKYSPGSNKKQQQQQQQQQQSSGMPTRQSFPTSLLLVELEVVNAMANENASSGTLMLQSKYPVENRSVQYVSSENRIRLYLQKQLNRSPRPSLESLLYDYHLLVQLPSIFGYDFIQQMVGDLVEQGKNGSGGSSPPKLSSYTRSIVNAFIKSEMS